MNVYCQACDKPLTGKQRKYCSDACRMRFNRSVRSQMLENSSENEQGIIKSFGVIRESFGNQPEQTILITLLVEYDTNGYETERDGWVIKTLFRGELMRWVGQTLTTEMPKWSFKVKKINLHKK